MEKQRGKWKSSKLTYYPSDPDSLPREIYERAFTEEPVAPPPDELKVQLPILLKNMRIRKSARPDSPTNQAITTLAVPTPTTPAPSSSSNAWDQMPHGVGPFLGMMFSAFQQSTGQPAGIPLQFNVNNTSPPIVGSMRLGNPSAPTIAMPPPPSNAPSTLSPVNSPEPHMKIKENLPMMVAEAEEDEITILTKDPVVDYELKMEAAMAASRKRAATHAALRQNKRLRLRTKTTPVATPKAKTKAAAKAKSKAKAKAKSMAEPPPPPIDAAVAEVPNYDDLIVFDRATQEAGASRITVRKRFTSRAYHLMKVRCEQSLLPSHASTEHARAAYKAASIEFDKQWPR